MTASRAARRVRAGDVLRAIERYGPASLASLMARIELDIRTTPMTVLRDRYEIGVGFGILMRGRLVWIANLKNGQERWGLTPAGRAVLAARRAGGRD